MWLQVLLKCYSFVLDFYSVKDLIPRTLALIYIINPIDETKQSCYTPIHKAPQFV